ncbi:hypothetical protein J2T21_000366 [Paeniglutamicibacter psychrophenolicus]|nr:hypothetical protein [Paeniglutamicibacter psychrophenolicus]
MDLASDEGESGSHFAQGFDDAVHERLFQVAFGNLAGNPEELESHIFSSGNIRLAELQPSR